MSYGLFKPIKDRNKELYFFPCGSIYNGDTGIYQYRYQKLNNDREMLPNFLFAKLSQGRPSEVC
jgi:hypothetical protein